jgi:glycosyltransferase involved in cell wall biosynthesis
MKILLANKFYYPRGGDCIYTIELEKLLKSKGHDVAIFSMKHNNNLPNEYEKYWPTCIEYSNKNFNNIKEALLRPLYSREVRQKFQDIINGFKPDVVHLNNIHSHLSPLIAQIAFYNKIPVVWTLHDYKLICPAYTCLRKNQTCELCFKNKRNVLKHKCIKGNTIGSFIGYLEATRWNKKKLQKYTNSFICPSNFLKGKMIESGFNEEKFVVINNFINENKIENDLTHKENYYCYFGRISQEKGIETLLKAASLLPNYNLKIIGTGPLEEILKSKYKAKNIEFLGYKLWNELREIVRRAKFTVVPSECYENNPLSIIESYTLGTPVLGSKIGGIPEIIQDGLNGVLFEAGNIKDLEQKIEKLYNNVDCTALGQKAREYAKENFSSQTYYKNIMNIYNNVVVK